METKQIQVGGAVIFWSAKDGTDRTMLKDKLSLIGLDKYCPEERTKLSALRVALQELYEDPKTLIRPLDTKEREGFCVVREDRGTDQNSYHNVLTAWMNGDNLIADGLGLETEEKIRIEQRKALNTLPATSVSTMLVKIIEKLGGTALRPNGAIYWLPEDKLVSWLAVAQIVETSHPGQNSVYTIKHVKDESAVKAVMDAIVHEAESEVRKIEQEIDDSELGERALEGRRDRAMEIKAKIARYEDLLGVELASIKENIDRVEQAAAKAVMMAAAEKEEVPA